MSYAEPKCDWCGKMLIKTKNGKYTGVCLTPCSSEMKDMIWQWYLNKHDVRVEA